MKAMSLGSVKVKVCIALAIVGLAAVSSVVLDPLRVSARSRGDAPQAAIHEVYAGVYETSSDSRTVHGGIGLFESGRYALMFVHGAAQSGTWTVEGDTIRLKGTASSDTVLKVLGPGRLAYDHNGAQTILTFKGANDQTPNRFAVLKYSGPVTDAVPGN